MDTIDENIKYANTLSGDFYSSHKEFENLKENIFAKSWQLIGDNSHLSQANFKKPFVFLEICQVRLDFKNFVLAQPSAKTTGLCVDTFTVVAGAGTGTRITPPTICGTNTDEHSMYFCFI